ncbi:calcium/calmodulin-dependent protein kinase [Plasmodium falciparum NF54]|uniref:Calcium/calmodulin-dependent protein kinase, putative n=8 Tax=Plasmodium falciparum TaxID=5833 RepID=A0A143ZZT8_PLAF7|nr:calcium/calmodulin-dependent protein kinase, putative [Plasmodium falciparum 3D7]KAF4326705.1 calcium/calmodulin-dependent protein kinase [Plasmodium falciparum NF54]PKC42189.1 calcium/calmodulin-dependent protein kinase [Plasmodium falciparum NF54]CZT62669.1 calcium/calmodulin-dependent protein kinase, putative [Plasmodium falciparum 3D7]|eukprot:XP_024329041.1 calcium/calmodulin-dependent protein kinase,putative [Plasmodium falciparum 3D7]
MVLKKTPFSFLYEIGYAEKTDRNINDIGRNNNLDLYENIQEYEIPELGNFRIVSILLKGFSSTVCLCQWILDLNETLTLCDYVRYINRNILNNNIQIVKGDHMEKREAISLWQDTTNIRSKTNMNTCIYPHIFNNAYVNVNMDVHLNNVHNLNQGLEGVEYIYPSGKPNIYNNIININNNLEGYKNKREETKEIAHINMFTHSDIIRNNEITNHYDQIYEPYNIMKRKNKDTYNIQIMNLVLKIKHKGLYYKIKEIEQLREEIEIHKDLKHTNILQIILCAEDENDIWIFLEYSSIGTLYSYVGFNILQEKQVQIIICQILYALYYLHIKGIIHCDIKPQNLLLFNFDQSICIQNNFLLYDHTLNHLNMKKLNFQKLFSHNNDHKTNQQNNVFNNIVKICDFGLSVKCGFNEFFPYRGIKGSYGFIAPELFHECNFNNKIDMWALGIVTFILLGGYRPFYPCSKFQEKVTFHERYWFNISSEAKDFIQSLLQINPEKRLNVIEAIEHPWVKNYFMNS